MGRAGGFFKGVKKNSEGVKGFFLEGLKSVQVEGVGTLSCW